MDSLPTATTTPWKKSDGFVSGERPKISLNHHVYRPNSNGGRTDPVVLKNKNDFSYNMYMLNRKFRRVQKKVEDHYEQYRKIAHQMEDRKQKIDDKRNDLMTEKKYVSQPNRNISSSRNSTESGASSVF